LICFIYLIFIFYSRNERRASFRASLTLVLPLVSGFRSGARELATSSVLLVLRRWPLREAR
jgi:hypothetical protein